LPSEAGFALEELERQKPTIVESALRILLNDTKTQPIETNARRLERNAAILAAQLTATTLANLLQDFPKPDATQATPTIATLAADAILRAAPKSQLAAAVAACAPDTIAAVVARLSGSALPVDVERAWAQVLARTKHDAAKAWADPRVALPD